MSPDEALRRLQASGLTGVISRHHPIIVVGGTAQNRVADITGYENAFSLVETDTGGFFIVGGPAHARLGRRHHVETLEGAVDFLLAVYRGEPIVSPG